MASEARVEAPSGAATHPARPPIRTAPRRSRWEPLIFAALTAGLAVVVFLNSPGLFTPDTTPQLYYAPGRTLVQALFSWAPNPFLGQAQFNAGIAPVAAVILLIRTIGVSAWATIRVWRLVLLVVAAWGAVRLYDRLAGDAARTSGRVAIAVLFVANPYVVISGATAPVLQPYALFPWMILAFSHALERPRSWRWAAAFALAFFAMGGLNAGIVPLFLLLGVPAYLIYARVVERRSWGALAGATIRCGLLAALVSLYWLVPAFLARGTGTTIAVTTERPQDVSSTSSFAETLRLLGLWPMYGRQGETPFLPNSIGYITNPFVVVISYLIPAAAAVAAFVSRSRVRVLSAALLVLGVPVVVGLFPPQSPSPFGRLLEHLFTSFPGAIGFRTTNKAGALVALAIALLIALGVVEAARRVFAAKLGVRLAALAVAVFLVAVSVYPALAGGLYVAGWTTIPAYWQRAATVLNRGPTDSRALLLPGEESATYRWGKRGPEDLNASLLSRSSVIRTTVPSGSSYAANFLAALDVPLASGTYRKGTLPLMAHYLGVRDVLVRNDMTWEQWGGVRPSVLADELREGDVRLVETYGRQGQFTYAGYPGSPGPAGSPRSDDALLPPLQRYIVAAPRPTVRAEPVVGTLLIDGDNFALNQLVGTGIAAGSPPFRLMGSMSANDLARALDHGARIVLTDSNRRRAWNFRRTGVDYSATLAAGQELRPGGDLSFGLFDDDSDTQTVSVLHGATSIVATGAGSVFGPSPGDQPWFAFDGDPNTAWLAGGFGSAAGQAVTVTLDKAMTVSRITFRPVVGPGRQIRNVRFRVGARVFTRTLPHGRAAVAVRIPPTAATRLSFAVASVWPGRDPRIRYANPVGFREIEIPGLSIQQVARLPLTFDRLAGQLDAPHEQELAAAPLDVLMTRELGGPANPRDDEEPVLARQFTLPDDRAFSLEGVGTVSPDLPDSVIDHLAGVPPWLVADSSSRLEGRIAYRASSALDGNQASAWSPDRGDSYAGQYIDVSFPQAKIDHIVVRQDQLPGVTVFPFVSAATLSLNGGPGKRVSLESGPTTITFPEQQVSSVRLTIDEVTGPRGAPRISELVIPNVSVPPMPASTPLSGCIDALQVDGNPLPVRLPGTLGRLAASTPFRFTSCSDRTMDLAAGTHELVSLPGWQIDSLRLSSPGTGGETAAPAGPPPTVMVTRQDATSMTISAAQASGPYWLVTGQGFDPRWTATMDGRAMGPPIVVDGYSVGWLVEDGSPHTFQVQFQPQRQLAVSLALSVAGLGLAVVLLVVGRKDDADGRRRRRRGAGPRPRRRRGRRRARSAGKHSAPNTRRAGATQPEPAGNGQAEVPPVAAGHDRGAVAGEPDG